MISQDYLPSHWDYLPIRSIFTESDTRCGDNQYDLLSVTQDRGIIKQADVDIKKDISNDDKSKYKVVLKNSIAYNKMRMWQGAVGINEINDGIVSPAYVVVNPTKEMNTKFYFYLFKTPYMISQFGKYSYGLVDDMNSLRYDDFQKLYIPIPALEEQNKIVNFIDQKSSQIEKFIQNKTRFIEILKEQKEAVINEAITKGLDNTLEFKDSEIEWLGDIPKHWETKKLKYIAKCLFSNVDKHTHENETEVFLCNYTDAYKNDTITNNLEFMKATATDDEIRKFLLLKDDVIITKDSETPDDMAVPTYVSENLNNVLCGYHLAIIRAKKELFGKFLYFLFMSTNFNIRFEIYSNGVTRYGLGNFIVNNSKIPLPPYEEQIQIVEHLENELNQIDKLIEKSTKQIELIKEYKTSLINEAVSGKIKIFKEKQNKKSREANIQFKRAVLGAYIIDNCLEDKTFGHVKFQKILYMCEAVNNLDFSSDYRRHAMGPHDPKMLHSIEKMIKKSRWFEAKKIDKRYIYQRLERSNDYRKYFDRYWNNENINMILMLFKTMDTQQSEIVATLYSAWSDLLKKDLDVTDEVIVNEVLTSWHENKKKISKDRWFTAIGWMKEINLVPNGAIDE